MKPVILIIDDEIIILKYLRKLLEKRYNILSADSGYSGLKLLSKRKIDLIIIDYLLPDIDGINLLKKIRHLHYNIPVIMISGHGSKNLVLKAWHEGANYYIDKPIDIESLRGKLEHFFCNRIDGPVSGIRFTAQTSSVNNIIKVTDEKLHQIRTVKDIANAVSMNSDYLSHIFKKSTGMSLSSYLTQKKILKAKELLRGKDYNIKEISYALGFSSPNTFYKIFKKNTGISPREYRFEVLQ